ncbi:hypothetical protein AR687_16445 [Flavobacteriaceae bacterium CRH]|nr:hypothetical protein AR687_16445 [Flavobacteriaceae bacterium CRH]
MDNELIITESWPKRNWKWFLPIIILLFIVIGFLLTSTNYKNTTDVFQAYSDNTLYERAIEKANANSNVQNILGKIGALDKLAILEGNVSYSNNHNSVSVTIRVKGTKKNGKLDFSCNRKGTVWEYKNIVIRTQNPKEKIVVLQESVKDL